ncbi:MULTISPECIES: cytoplasmic incompatibility factor CifA [unclassified Wolbachia]|uniref:cytoplasmic incompatibility factor CifA n=1 Tax=unclassified Wolbachia TaxID=2640676 RepID=UPI0022313FFD|nr:MULTISPECIES: cytoplasmic incompatibility factor CifA [unclassified Wolbachia]
MPIETERHAAVLKKLQDVIKHENPDIVAGRKLAIKRWVETYVDHIKCFKDDKLEFLCLIFKDEGCWVKLDKDKPGTRLNNTFLRERVTEEKIDERDNSLRIRIDNPLRRYEMACSYCVVDKIHQLFEERFKAYKKRVPSGAFKGKTETEINEYVRKSLLGSMKRNGDVFNFWIDKESGELKQPSNAEEGFDSAVKLKWSEGVEYFYNLLKEEDKEKKLTEAILALSRVQSVEKDAPILDFCVNNITDKGVLLQRLLRKDKGVYALLAELIDSCFFDTVHDLMQCWCYRGLLEQGDHSDKIFSQREYEVLLSSISNVMLKNPESSVQARSLIMKIWECDRLSEYKKAAVNTSNYTVHISGMLAGLIVNWKREDVCKPDGKEEIEKEEIKNIILFARDSFPEKFSLFKEVMIENLRLCGREGKKEGMDYVKLAEELLFSKLEREPLPARNGGSRVIVEAEDPSFSRSPIRHDASGDGPGSELESPDVSPSGSPERKKPFTPSGNK